MSVKIFTMTHKKFDEPSDKMYIPLQVGRAIHDDLGYIGDDSGDNISAKNPYYGELSGVYWVWKNCTDVQYVGICHYRRYLINEWDKVLTKSEILDILKDHDVIVTKKLSLNSKYYDGYAKNHNIYDLLMTEKVIKEKEPLYYENFVRLVHSNETYFGNIMITSKKIFDEYCKWLFGIFFEVEKYVDFSNYDNYHMRVFGFISEFLLFVWLKTNNLSVYECKVGMLGEKAETKELKMKLAKYFKNHDIEGAKEYFLKIQKDRPDVLMEASDITGELKLSMQVIATAEFEQSEYGHTFLERTDEFDGLMTYFGNINNVVNNYKIGMNTQKDENFLKNTKISKEALKISAMLFCEDEEALNNLIDKIYKVKDFT